MHFDLDKPAGKITNSDKSCLELSNLMQRDTRHAPCITRHLWEKLGVKAPAAAVNQSTVCIFLYIKTDIISRFSTMYRYCLGMVSSVDQLVHFSSMKQNTYSRPRSCKIRSNSRTDKGGKFMCGRA